MERKNNNKLVGIFLIIVLIISVLFIFFLKMPKENKHDYTKETHGMVYEIDTFVTSNDKYQRGIIVYDTMEGKYIYLTTEKYDHTNNRVFELMCGDELVVTYDAETNELLDFGYKFLQQ